MRWNEQEYVDSLCVEEGIELERLGEQLQTAFLTQTAVTRRLRVMNIIYRKNKFSKWSKWHFNERCQHWPKKHVVETTFLDTEKGDRICEDCTRLSTEMSKLQKHN